MDLLEVFFYYMGVINILGFLFMGIDKRKAIKGNWRIRERTLWEIAMIGGALGSYIGMRVFHHKTKHTSFKIGMPLIFIVQILFVGYIFLS